MNHAKTVQQCLYFSKLSLLQKQDFLTLTKNQPSTETHKKQQLWLEEGFKGHIYCAENWVRGTVAVGKLIDIAKPN